MNKQLILCFSIMLFLFSCDVREGGDTGETTSGEHQEDTTRAWTIGQEVKKDYKNDKIALIIANDDYQHVGDLTGPGRVGTQLKQVLSESRVRVVFKKDVPLERMKTVLKEFSEQSEQYSSILFFYLGHALQIDGENFIAPVDAAAKLKEEVPTQMMNLNDALAQIQGVGNKKPMLAVLDACRENPFAELKGASIARNEKIDQTNRVVAFTTGKNTLAKDNNPYLQFFMEELKKGLCVEDMLKKTEERVLAKFPKQQPLRSGTLSGPICFNEKDMVLVEGNNQGITSFFMSNHEVTVQEFNTYCAAKKLDAKSGKPQQPVANVSYDEAQAYCAWLKETTGKAYRLPTLEEWEYAATNRGTSKMKYAGSDNYKEVANFLSVSFGQVKPVKSFKANGLGLFDMSGNVWEWCATEHAKSSPEKLAYYIKGASFMDDSDKVEAVMYKGEKAFRYATGNGRNLGFRVVF